MRFLGLMVLAILLIGQIRFPAGVRKAAGGGGGGGADSITDNFNRADEYPIQSPWTTPLLNWEDMTIRSNELAKDSLAELSSSYTGAYHTGMKSLNGEVQFEFRSGDPIWGIAVRVSEDGQTFYWLQAGNGGQKAYWLKEGPNAAALEEGIDDIEQAEAGDVFKVTVSGTSTVTLTLYKNGAFVSSAVDNTNTIADSGYGGLYMNYKTTRLDNFKHKRTP